MRIEDLLQLRTLLIESRSDFDLSESIIAKQIQHKNISGRALESETKTNIQTINSLFDSMVDTNKKILELIDQKITLVEEQIDSIPKEEFYPEYHQLLFDDEREIIAQINSLKSIKLAKEKMSNSISEYANWTHPGLQISCYSGIPCKSILACDPLYFVDANRSQIDDIVRDYPKLFQRKVRRYAIGRKQFNLLPQQSFGLVVCWNVFNYFSLENIKTYLESVWPLLLPGGVFAFTYNNCDLLQSAKLCYEYKTMCWATERDITKIVNSIGFEVIKFEDYQMGGADANYLSWVEIRRPGTLKTIKRGAIIGELVEK